MTCWAISGIVVSLVVLLGLLPVGIDASWGSGALSLKIKAGPVPFRVLPKKPDRKKRRDKSPSSGKANEEPASDSLPGLKALVLRGFEALCLAVRRARVDTLCIHYTAAGSDPYRVAMMYLAVGTAMEGLLAVIGERIAHTDLRTAIDFDGGEQVFSGTVVTTLRLYQAAAIGGRFALGLWKDWRACRKNGKGAEDGE